MKKIDLEQVPEYYHNFLKLVPLEKDLSETFREVGILCWRQNSVALEKCWNERYAPKKWTAGQVLTHVLDTERVFSFRILAALRGDTGIYPGFDEDVYAENNLALNRTPVSVLEEIEMVRESTYALFRYANEEEKNRRMTASGKNISALEMGYIIMGHSLHHFNVVKERYFTMNS